MSNELVLVDVVGLGDPADGARPSLPGWAFDQVAARGCQLVAEFRVPPEHSGPEDDWPLEPYWTVVLQKEVQVVGEGGEGSVFFQAVDLVSWGAERGGPMWLFPELLRRLIDLVEQALWLRVEEAA